MLEHTDNGVLWVGGCELSQAVKKDLRCNL